MTRMELITLIGDVLTRLDVLRGSLMPDDPNRHQLDELRDSLDAKQRKLAQNQFDDNMAAFQQATTQLTSVNAALRVTIGQIQRVVDTLANLTRFVSAVDTIVGIAVPF